jgi:hypothetical protein
MRCGESERVCVGLHTLEWGLGHAAYPFTFHAGAVLFWLPFMFAWRHASAYWLYCDSPSGRHGIGYWTWLGLQSRVQPQPETPYWKMLADEAERRRAVLAGEIGPLPERSLLHAQRPKGPDSRT